MCICRPGSVVCDFQLYFDGTQNVSAIYVDIIVAMDELGTTRIALESVYYNMNIDDQMTINELGHGKSVCLPASQPAQQHDHPYPDPPSVRLFVCISIISVNANLPYQMTQF